MTGETCGCCSGVASRTPVAVANRPGLSAIAYRAGTHRDFLASLLAGIGAGDPLTTRDRDDFTIALLDAWAVAADVLAFYTERLAQESYLRTARERLSLQELGRLIGYRLRPGVAAETHLAFALEAPPAPPPAATMDPGSAPPVVPQAVTLEAALRVQSIPAPGEQPQTFETVEEIEARPEWNALPAATTIAHAPALGDTHAYLAGAALNLKPGDAFLLAGGDVLGEHWDLRILSAVEADAAADRTRVTWSEPLGSLSPYVLPASPAEPYVLRKRLNAFGHNAPLWLGMSIQFRKEYRDGAGEGDSEWPGFEISAASGDVVDLDGSHPDVVRDSWVVLSIPTYRELFRVASVGELARAEFGISGKVTRITLAGGEHYSTFDDEVRDLVVFAASDRLALAEGPDASAVEGDTIDVVSDADLAGLAGRTLLVRGTTTEGVEHAEPAVCESVETHDARRRLVLAESLAGHYVRGTVVVHGNVALATHGETVQEVLGSGRAAQPFQRFALSHEPLTYRQSTDASGATAELEVRVNDVRWDEVPTLYGAAAGARAYVVRPDEQGRTTVEFGDGERGARLPTGSNNVRARYRKGLGAAGNVKIGALAQLLDRPLGLKGVANPAPATGGIDPEPEEAARASIPLAVRTLGRAVSLLDYEDFARAFAGVAKAHATILPLRGGRTIVVTVAGTDRFEDLATALRTYGDPRVPIAVVPSVEQTFRLALKVAVDPAYAADAVLAAVEAALRDGYSFGRRGLLEPVYRSRVVSDAHAVAGVVAVDVDRLYTGTTAGLANRLPALQPAGDPPTGAGLLLLDPGPLDWLEQMT